MADISGVPTPRRLRRSSRRLRFILALSVAAIIVLLVSLRGLASFYTNYLWFDSLGFTAVWRGVLFAKIGLALFFIAFTFLLFWINLFVADRIAPRTRPQGPEEDFVSRYHDTIGPRAGLFRIAVAGLFSLFLGVGTSSRWQDWILFRNSQDFGVKDPQFNMDIGFYVFELPFIQFLINWMFTAFIVVLIITAAAHYLNGGIRVNTPGNRVTAPVKGHLSVLLAILALIKAADYWYQRYSLNFSGRGVVDGASYTDVNAQLPAIKLLILISIAAVILLIINIWRRGWVLPVVAVGLWAFVTIAIGSIYPAIYQRFVVEPSESSREAQYIERNIEATRTAYGLRVETETEADANIIERTFTPNVEDALTIEILQRNAGTLNNLRLLDPGIVSPTFQALEVEREQFRFASDLDVDRYEVDGDTRTVVIAARELNLDGVNSGWENQHVAFTHGYGLALAPANTVTAQGEPDFVIGGLPTSVNSERINIDIDQPRIYVGEELEGYVIVETERCEIDFALTGSENLGQGDSLEEGGCQGSDGSGENLLFRYDGNDGVKAGSFFRRIAFALRFGDLNPIFSGLINSDSKFLFNRDVTDRAKELAPFLKYDADSYPVIIDGRIKFIIDAYTATNYYPYSQTADRNSVPSSSGLADSFNYVRNSVKVVIDAYDGDVTFYVIDDQDPIIQAYMKAFPNLFTIAFPDDGSSEGMPSEVADHLRYPEDLFKVQTNMWGRYHLNDPNDFYEAAGAWVVSLDPGDDLENAPTAIVTTTGFVTFASGKRMDPYYVQMQVPQEQQQDFILIRPFVPRSSDDSRQQLEAFMVGQIDQNGQGNLISYTVPGLKVDGPVIANRSMLADPVVAETTTLLGQRGSGVKLGNMLLIPLEGAEEDVLLYLRPMYVEASGSQPAVQQVIAAYGERVRICSSVELVLGALLVPDSEVGDDCENVNPVDLGGTLLPVAPPENEESTQPSDGSVESESGEDNQSESAPDNSSGNELQNLIEQARQAFESANEALEDGDLGRYQDLIEQGQSLVQQAAEILESN